MNEGGYAEKIGKEGEMNTREQRLKARIEKTGIYSPEITASILSNAPDEEFQTATIVEVHPIGVKGIGEDLEIGDAEYSEIASRFKEMVKDGLEGVMDAGLGHRVIDPAICAAVDGIARATSFWDGGDSGLLALARIATYLQITNNPYRNVGIEVVKIINAAVAKNEAS